MDEESLRNRLLNRLKDQQQSIPKDVEISSMIKSQDTSMNITLDSEISSGDMADSKGEEDNVVKERAKKTHTPRKQSRERKEKGKEVKSKKTPRDVKHKIHDNKSEQKNEDKKTQREKDGKKENQQQKSVVRLKKNISSVHRSPSPAKRSRYSPEQRYKRHRDRSHSRDSRHGSRDRRDRSRSPDGRGRRRKSLSRNRDRYCVSPRRDRHSPPRRESRGRRDNRSPRRRRYFSRSRSRSVCYRSDSTTSFSISSYGSDMDTSLRERDVTSTTSGVPAGFGQGLYIPQLNQTEENKGGIGHLLTAIRQGQNLQSKSTAIAQYTAIFQQISAREDELKPSSTEVPTVETTQESIHESKFKFIEQEFPVSHGSEHRKAAFHSEIAATNEVTEEQQPFTDPASLSKMMLGIKPGRYIGDKVVCLPLSQLEGGDPAWVKKNQFKGLAPVRDGIGRKLMEKMGWREGMPLGKSGYGAVIPLELDVKTDRKGLGVGSNKEFPFLPPPPVNNTSFYSPVPINTTASPAGVLDLSSRLEANVLAGGKHPVCVLMEICAKRHWSNPVFEEVGEQGPKFFKYRVNTSMGCYQPQFNSVTKKEAKRQAALACLQALGQVPAKDMTPPTLPLPPQNILHSQVIQNMSLTPQYPGMLCPRPISTPIYAPPLVPQSLPTYLPTNVVPAVSHIPVYQKPYAM